MISRDIIKELESQKNEKNVAGMKRFGIQGEKMLGISIPILRKRSRDIEKSDSDNHQLALDLWNTEIHEARILAGMIDEPGKVTARQMDNWTKDFDSWDVCDQVCMNLFDKTDVAFEKAIEWTKRKGEFEKRAGFALMAALAWHRRDISDAKIAKFFPYIIDESTDERNYVKKAVNWALRQIGKRSAILKKEAIKTAREISKLDNKTARWVASDALKEFTR